VNLSRILKRSLDPRQKEINDWVKRMFRMKPLRIDLYVKAFRHKSAARNIHNQPETSNERLEFLGDAILDAAVADYLFQKYQEAEEGQLTKMKSRIVSRSNLNAMALKMGIHDLLETDLQAQNARDSLAGNAFEAVLGALYLDHGYKRAHDAILRILDGYADLGRLEYMEADFKSRLFEEAHRIRVDLKFITRAVNRDKTEPSFLSQVIFDNKALGEGEGSSKKKAEQRAAREALIRLNVLEQ
jgi:ribonuclease-3